MFSSATTKTIHVILDFDIISEIITFEEKGRFGKKLQKMQKTQLTCLMKMQSIMKLKNIIPVRGPEKYENNGYTYIFKTTGTLENFGEIEQIYKNDILIYELHCSGGIIE